VAGSKPTVLSKKRRDLLCFIIAFKADRGYPPSIRQMMTNANLKSPCSIQAQLAGLEDLGYIRRDFNVVRGILVLKGADE
jgi:repressor LexA